MISRVILATYSLTVLTLFVNAQQPRYTSKKFVNYQDEKEFKVIKTENGIGRTYLLVDAEIWDTDDDNTTHFRGGRGDVLVRIEGTIKKGKKNGLFTSYVMDSANHSKLFKIWEQQYINNQLNGEWRFFNLKGTLVKVQTYKNDSLHGSAKNYWIDGKSLMSERIFDFGSSKFLQREFYKNNNLKSEYSFVKDSVMVYAKEFYESGKLKYEVGITNKDAEGPAKRYYEDGTLMEESYLKAGKFEKTRKYYHPNGQLWIEQIYKKGLPWQIIANYDSGGKKRDAGSLKEGNGTVIFYTDDGSVREIVTYINGERRK